MAKAPESLWEVYRLMVALNPHGKSNKQIAMEVRPDLSEERAKEWLSKVLTEHSGRTMREDERERFFDACDNAELLINYLCDRYDYEHPARRIKLTPEKELRVLRQIIKEHGIKVHTHLEQHKELINLDVAKGLLVKLIKQLGRLQ